MIMVVLAWILVAAAAWFAAAALTRIVGAAPGCGTGLGYGLVIVVSAATVEYYLTLRGEFAAPPEWLPPVQVLVSTVLLLVVTLLPHRRVNGDHQHRDDPIY
ncbi:MAG TPA: hypothetical protein VIT65_05090 [Microlunatus sp.]|jgi:hypothetical protein